MDDLVVKKVTSILLPFLQVYGFYVLLHGHLSPGGGFAGGAIIGASIILFIIIFGAQEGKKINPRLSVIVVKSIGAISYIMIGLVGITLGGNFLTSGNLGLELGLFLEPTIGLVVASVLVSLFYELIREDKSYASNNN